LDELEAFIVRAKACTYVGGGASRPSSRPASHDIGHEDGLWSYLDSYFGGTDFLGQEVVWCRGEPAWAMNYYGRIVLADRIDAATAGAIIKEALAALYREGRFLGGFTFDAAAGRYCDRSQGDYRCFRGTEEITIGGDLVYRLDYHGGLVKP
jgi:hypothetical protein